MNKLECTNLPGDLGGAIMCSQRVLTGLYPQGRSSHSPVFLTILTHSSLPRRLSGSFFAQFVKTRLELDVDQFLNGVTGSDLLNPSHIGKV